MIDDEAELSDWISDLKTDSSRLGLNSDSGDESNRRSGRVTGNFKEREKFRGEDRNSKGSRGPVKKTRGFYSENDDDGKGDYSAGSSPWRERGGRGRGDMSVARKGPRGNGFGGRSGGGRKDSDFDFPDDARSSRGGGYSSRRKDVAAGSSEKLRGGQRGQRGRGLDFSLSEEETGDESDEGFSSRKKGRGVSISVRQRGAKTGRGGRDSGLDMSEEEIVSDSDEGFSDDEDLIQGKKDKMKDGLSGVDSGSSLRSEKSDEGERDENTVRDSVGENDSYLSQKR